MLARRPSDPGDLIPYEGMRNSSEERVGRDKAAHSLIQEADRSRSLRLHDVNAGRQSPASRRDGSRWSAAARYCLRGAVQPKSVGSMTTWASLALLNTEV